MKRVAAWIIDERVVAVVIGLNTIFIGAVLAEPPGLSDDVSRWGWAHKGDYACALYFIVEALLKIGLLGWQRYWAPVEGRWWNRFDFSIALASIPVAVAPLVGGYAHGFLFFMVLRTTRLLRLLRFMRFIPNLPRLMAGVPRALLTSSGIVMALAVALLVFAFSAAVLFPESEHFQHPGTAVFSMFKILTLEEWTELEKGLEEGAEGWRLVGIRAFITLAVVGFGLIGVSLATAVLVDEMRADDSADMHQRFDAMESQIRDLKSDLEVLRSHLGARPPGPEG